jgi:hypothetical protein
VSKPNRIVVVLNVLFSSASFASSSEKTLDRGAIQWYMLYHDKTYYIWRSCQIAAHRAGERSDAGRLGSGSMFG